MLPIRLDKLKKEVDKMSKIVVLLSALLFISACSTTGNTVSGGASGEISPSTAADKYRVASEGLDVFDPISGSDVGARASDRVFFAYDSSVISTSEQSTLDRQAKWLKKNKDVSITVEGHCDERGTREYNLALGERRANAVKRYLVSSGIPAGRIKTVSFGKERPAVLGSTPAAHAENRRAVTVLKN